jgi:HK97 family phage prohead protease
VTQVVYGILCDALGHASADGKFWSTPSAAIRTVQNEEIRIDRDHSGVWCGRVTHLERHAGQLWCVGEVNDVSPVVHVRVASEVVELESDLFWSVSRFGDPEIGYVINSVSLTTTPARICPTPVTILEGDLYRGKKWAVDGYQAELLERAAETKIERRGNPIIVHGERPHSAHGMETSFERATRAIEVRSAAAVDVNVARREMDVVVCPAGVETMIHEPGRSFSEVMDFGAFAGCEDAPERIKVNMYHQRHRVIGRAVSLDPWAETGLEATLRLAKTEAADEALALAEDDCLDVSAGFAIPAGGEEWSSDRKRRRVRRAVLHHVALVDQGAYPGAVITGMRSDGLLAGIRP